MAPRKKIPPKVGPKKTSKKMAESALKQKPTTLDILTDWCKRGFYVYLRPISSKWEQPERKPEVVIWKVEVQWRNVDWFKFNAESHTTPDAAIREIAAQIPKTAKHAGGMPLGGMVSKPKPEKAKGAVKKRRKKITR